MQNDDNIHDSDFPNSLRLTPAAIRALDNLFDSAPPQELRENLLEIYHTYLVHAHHTLPLDFEKMARNIYLLTNCLLTVGEELSGK
jgi:hypothetical protein